MTEGQIIEWNKKEGEKVEAGEILLEIMTDKTSMELEAEESGYLIKILKSDGETVPVTEIIGYIGAEGEAAPDSSVNTVTEKTPSQTIPEKVDEPSQTPKKEKSEDEFDVVVNGETILRTDKIILAGGSKVGKINIPGIESNKVLTSDDILDLQKIPKSFTVIEGGIVGIELGQVFLSFGSEVTVVEMTGIILQSNWRDMMTLFLKKHYYQ